MQWFSSIGGILPQFLPSLLGGLITGTLCFLIARRFESQIGTHLRPLLAVVSSVSDRLIFVLIGVYFLVFATMSILRHDSFHSNAYDLGIFDQVIWNTAQGRLFQETVMIEYSTSLLGNHFSPILLVFVPLYWVIPDARVLLVIQTAALAIGALPIYWLARDKLRNPPAALALTSGYFLFPALHYVNLFDFHEIAIASPFLTFAIYFLINRRYRPFAVSLFIALLSREEIAIVTIGFGIWILLMQRQWKVGTAVLATGVAWAYATIVVIIPYFQGTNDYYYVLRYSYLGKSVWEIVTNMVLNPQYLFFIFGSPQRVEYILHLLVPLGLIPALGLEVLVLSFPSLLYLLLSSYKEMYQLTNQYSAVLIPAIFMASVHGVTLLVRRKKANTNVYLWAVIGYMLASSIISYYLFSPGPFAQHSRLDRYVIDEHTRIGKEIISNSIPRNASVAAQTDIVPHLSHREAIYMFPYLHNADYILLDQSARTWPLDRQQYTAAVEDLKSNPVYRLALERDGYLLFTKRSEPPTYTYADVGVGGSLWVAGYELRKSTVRAGENVDIAIYWKMRGNAQNSRRIPRLITILRLIGRDGKVISERGKEPGDGALQTDRWIGGDLVRERYSIPVPSGVNPGDYTIAVGIKSFSKASESLSAANTASIASIRIQ